MDNAKVGGRRTIVGKFEERNGDEVDHHHDKEEEKLQLEGESERSKRATADNKMGTLQCVEEDDSERGKSSDPVNIPTEGRYALSEEEKLMSSQNAEDKKKRMTK